MQARKLLLVAAPVVALFAAINVADALDAYSADTKPTHWIIASGLVYGFLFLALLLVCAEAILTWREHVRQISLLRRVRTVSESKRAAAAEKSDDNDDDDNVGSSSSTAIYTKDMQPKAKNYYLYLAVRMTDFVVDSWFLCSALLTVTLAEHHLNGGTPAWPLALLPGYLGIGLYLGLLINGTVRTFTQYRLQSADNCCVGLFGCCFCRGANEALETAAAEKRSERNTLAQPALEAQYVQRAEYQDDSRVYVCVPQALPVSRVPSRIEALLGWFRLGMLMAFVVLVTLRLVQNDVATEHEADALAKAAAASGLVVPVAMHPLPPPLVRAGALQGIVHFISPLQNRTELQERLANVNHRLIKSLATWRSAHVVPMSVVFLPIFLWQAAYFLKTIPVTIVMIRMRARLSAFLDWMTEHFIMTLLVIFEIVFVTHVDDAVLERRSWHATFAALYCALALLAVWLGITRFLCASWSSSPPPAKRTLISRWGVVVYNTE